MRAKPFAAPAFRAGLLRRLARDTAGNTMMLVAAALIPLTAMIGSGVDMARVYMVKSRLQQACDAGALAGRKYLAGATISGEALTRSTAFFNSNFPANSFGTTDVTFTPVRTDDGQVRGTASARVPMAVMKLFGSEHIDLNVACQARFEVSNTDVMLVLDVTGSMAECPDGSGSCAGGAGSKIEALRAAVLNFYDTLDAATGDESRFRLGFVPYSSAVNVGIDPFTNSQILNPDWLVDSWTYQSRIANMNKPGYSPLTTYSATIEQTYGDSVISNTNCNNYGSNKSFSQKIGSITYSFTGDGNPTVPVNDIFTNTGAPPDVTQIVYKRKSNSYSGNKSCVREYRTATTTYALNGRFAFSSWDYKPVSYDTSVFKTGVAVKVYASNSTPGGSVIGAGPYNMWELVNDPGSTVPFSSTVYDGCVEERDTVAQATFTTMPNPDTAWDLNVVTTPYDTATRWRPMWHEVVRDRTTLAPEIGVATNRANVTSYCPVAASKLAVRDRSDVESYVDDLEPTGNTYHDLGMAWGIRMLSPVGMWAAENTAAPNGRPISRHIIFMSDGNLVSPPAIYNAHGFERWDRRVVGAGTTPTDTNLRDRHLARFQALCNRARSSNNITVWTIGFGNEIPANLRTCADSGKWFEATNTTELTAQFQQIAANIARLRLSQ